MYNLTVLKGMYAVIQRLFLIQIIVILGLLCTVTQSRRWTLQILFLCKMQVSTCRVQIYDLWLNFISVALSKHNGDKSAVHKSCKSNQIHEAKNNNNPIHYWKLKKIRLPEMPLMWEFSENHLLKFTKPTTSLPSTLPKTPLECLFVLLQPTRAV